MGLQTWVNRIKWDKGRRVRHLFERIEELNLGKRDEDNILNFLDSKADLNFKLEKKEMY